MIAGELHEAAAPTYKRLLGRLAPKVLLGLTATPERTDGEDFLHYFDERIAAEMRLWDALERNLVCPFQPGFAWSRRLISPGSAAIRWAIPGRAKRTTWRGVAGCRSGRGPPDGLPGVSALLQSNP